MIYLQLFLSFLQVGMFSVGGGYAAMPLIQSQVVEQHGWLTMLWDLRKFADWFDMHLRRDGGIR